MKYTAVASLRGLAEAAWFIPVCFALFLIVRILLVALVPLEMHSDAGWYFSRAVDLAAGRGYSEGGHPTAFWPVGYPGFLGGLFSVFGSHLIVGQVANLFLAAATFFLVLGLARHLFQSEAVARLSVLLLALYPNNIAYTPILLTEIYFTFLLLLGVYLFLVKKGWLWLFAAGLIFGVATLTKPQVLFLPGILVLFRLIQVKEVRLFRGPLLAGLVIYSAVAMVLVPWAVRNTLVFGQPVLISTNGGVTLLTGNNPSADGGYVEKDPLVDQRNFSVQDQVASDQRAKALAVQWIKDHPARFMELMPLKLWQLWYKDGEAEWAYQAGHAGYEQNRTWFRVMRGINQVYYVLLMLGVVASLFLVGKREHVVNRPWVMFGYAFIVYLSLISLVFSGQSRFHFPAMPWAIMYCAWALTVWSQGARRGESSRV